MSSLINLADPPIIVSATTDIPGSGIGDPIIVDSNSEISLLSLRPSDIHKKQFPLEYNQLSDEGKKQFEILWKLTEEYLALPRDKAKINSFSLQKVFSSGSAKLCLNEMKDFDLTKFFREREICLIGAELDDAQLNDAQLNDAQLNDAQLDGAQLDGAKFNDAGKLNDGTKLKNASLLGIKAQKIFINDTEYDVKTQQNQIIAWFNDKGVKEISFASAA